MDNTFPTLKIEDTDIKVSKDKPFTTKVFLFILRFYFIFSPMYPLVSTFVGTSLWKDAIYVLCTILGLHALLKNRFFIIYLLSILFIIFLQVSQGYQYWEYLKWFFIGIPLYLYFRYINPAQFKLDLWIIIIIMLVGFFFVFLHEIPSKDSSFFSTEDASKTSGTVLLREGLTRARYCFVSPMAYSQYCWFIALTVLVNNNFKKIFRIFFALVMTFIIFFINTRAGVFLTILCAGTYVYNKFGFYKYRIYNLLAIIVLSSLVILKNFVSSVRTNHNNETLSDELRIYYLLDGVHKASEHFILGISGAYFSPRFEDWYDFENSWLSLIVCFGVVGIFLIFYLIKTIVFRHNDKYLILYIIPWLSYSAIFPILQELCAVFITWYILGAILNLEKWKKLNNLAE